MSQYAPTVINALLAFYQSLQRRMRYAVGESCLEIIGGRWRLTHCVILGVDPESDEMVSCIRE
jgi:hypothetical protein